MLKKKPILYIIILFFGVLLTGCGDKIAPGTTQEGEKKIVKAPVATANVIQQTFFYEAVGTVEARTASTISSKLMGTVKAVHVREGDMVKKGDLLVLIDKRQVAAQLKKGRSRSG